MNAINKSHRRFMRYNEGGAINSPIGPKRMKPRNEIRSPVNNLSCSSLILSHLDPFLFHIFYRIYFLFFNSFWNDSNWFFSMKNAIKPHSIQTEKSELMESWAYFSSNFPPKSKLCVGFPSSFLILPSQKGQVSSLVNFIETPH